MSWYILAAGAKLVPHANVFLLALMLTADWLTVQTHHITTCTVQFCFHHAKNGEEPA